jgi:hypothetical protein
MMSAFPSKSPDILVSFYADPQRPFFDDFAFSSPRSSDKTTHFQAAQVFCNTKHHQYPDDVFFPLAAERSGYLYPTFISFIDTFFAEVSSARPSPSDRLDVLYAIAHADTYMTESLLHAASFSLTPSSLTSLYPPPPFILPLRWVSHFWFMHLVTARGPPSGLLLIQLDTCVAALVKPFCELTPAHSHHVVITVITMPLSTLP